MERFYTLHNGNAVATVDFFGGELVQYRSADGTERLWDGQPEIWGDWSPILFPVVDFLKENTITIAGKPYEMIPHGFARKSWFSVLRQEPQRIELILRASEETKAQYPFDFCLHVIHELLEDGFQTTYVVDNPNQSVLPFCIGGHPGFRCPMAAGTQFEAYELVFPTAESGTIAQLEQGRYVRGLTVLPLRENRILPLTRDLFQTHATLIFTDLQSRQVVLQHRDTGRGVRLQFSGFPVLGVWTYPDPRATFLCLEPWHGLPAWTDETGRMEDKPHLISLESGSSFSLAYSAHFF